jgi:N-acetylglucosaminyldiphosphoundecaprenol N-acetyl-beta-D-mannosaminyltransferase
MDMDAAVDVCERAVVRRRPLQHMAINAAKLVAMHDDADLRDTVLGCGLITADGQSVVWAARLLGDPVPERVAGIDLMHRLIARAAEHGHSVYFLGARPDVLEEAVRRLRSEHRDLRIAGYHDGYFGRAEEPQVADEIRAAAPDMLFVAMPTPQKEYFLSEHGERMGVPFSMGVGGAIDVVAGVARRAPVLMQRAGLEWLFRLAQEPRRMFRRYLTTNSRFIVMVARSWLAGASHRLG